jgi:WD40 repeat protein
MLYKRTHRRTRLPERLVRACGVVLAVGAALVLVLGPSASAMTGGAELWVARYNGPGSGIDRASSLAASPDGSKVFIAGSSQGATGYDFATLAYDASTGARLWARRYDGPANGRDEAHSVAASPDGSKVFVTGWSQGATGYDFATVAYDAATGARLWARRYNGTANGNEAFSVAASPDGSKVFVTGSTGYDYATLAYDAGTGATLWARRYNGPANGDDVADSVAASPDGSKVFVTGYSSGGSWTDFATVAYDAATGAGLWARRYDGPANNADDAFSVAASPDGSKVFVTGSSDRGWAKGTDFATVAYDAWTGARLWVERYNGAKNGNDGAYSVAASPDGSKVVVTGFSDRAATGGDAATVAYDASTGAQLWVARDNGPANGEDFAGSVAASPDGSKVFITGWSDGAATGEDFLTVAYAA